MILCYFSSFLTGFFLKFNWTFGPIEFYMEAKATMTSLSIVP